MKTLKFTLPGLLCCALFSTTLLAQSEAPQAEKNKKTVIIKKDGADVQVLEDIATDLIIDEEELEGQIVKIIRNSEEVENGKIRKEIEVIIDEVVEGMDAKSWSFMRGEDGPAWTSHEERTIHDYPCDVLLGVHVSRGSGHSERGFPVNGIIAEGPAELAGLQRGDRILRISGEQIDSYNDLHRVLKSEGEGATVSLEYLHDDQPISLPQVTLRQCSEEERAALGPKVRTIDDYPCDVLLGVHVSQSPPDGQAGFPLNGIIAKGPAAKATMQGGDRILSIAEQPVNSYDDLHRILQWQGPGAIVPITWLRDGKEMSAPAVTLRQCSEEEKAREEEEKPFLEKWVMQFREEFEPEVERQVIIITNGEENSTESEDDLATDEPTDDTITQLQPKPAAGSLLQLEAFRAYPNPTAGMLNVVFTAEPVPTAVRITDASGRIVYFEELPNFNGNYQREINLARATSSSLFLSVSQNGRIYSEPVLLMRP